MKTRTTARDDARLGPVAAVVLAVCLVANLAAGLDTIERRAARVTRTLAHGGRVAATLVERAAARARCLADEEAACARRGALCGVDARR